MNAHTRKARWLALTAGFVLMGGGILSADVSSQKVGSYRPTGSISLVYAVYLPGHLSAGDQTLAVDAMQRAYVSQWTRFPEQLPGIPIPGAPPGPPYGPYPNPYMDGDAFVVGFGATGQPFFQAFVAGPAIDVARALATDSSAIYVAREAFDTEGSLIYVDKLNANAVAPALYSTLVLGGHWATVNDIAVDSAGNAYITGRTGNRTYYNETNPNHEAAYIAKLDPDGAVRYIHELDGEESDEGLKIEVDEDGNAYVSGITNSPDFPVIGNPPGGTCHARQFVAKIDASGAVLYSRCYGGGRILDIFAPSNGQIYLAKATVDSSPETLEAFIQLNSLGFLADIIYVGEIGIGSIAGFSFFRGGYFYVMGLGHPDHPGCLDSSLARLNSGLGISTSICLPGVTLNALAVDRAGNAYVTGQVASAGFFPAAGVGKPFLAKFAFTRPPDCSAATASPNTLWPPNGSLIPVSVQGVIDPDGDPVTVRLIDIHQDEPLSQNAFDATGIGTSTARLRADRRGDGDGRVYHLSFEARDEEGATCRGTVRVCVPHDQRPGATCGDGGAHFDSAGD